LWNHACAYDPAVRWCPALTRPCAKAGSRRRLGFRPWEPLNAGAVDFPPGGSGRAALNSGGWVNAGKLNGTITPEILGAAPLLCGALCVFCPLLPCPAVNGDATELIAGRANARFNVVK